MANATRFWRRTDLTHPLTWTTSSEGGSARSWRMVGEVNVESSLRDTAAGASAALAADRKPSIFCGHRHE